MPLPSPALLLISLLPLACCALEGHPQSTASHGLTAATRPANSQPSTTAPAATLPAATEPAAPTERVAIAGESFSLELAIDFAARAQGLMNRTSIDPHGGMLFVFEDELERSFWMANCPIDMDILFLDSSGRITAMHAMKAEKPRGENESQAAYEFRLRTYESRKPAQFAIELKAGSLKRLKLRPGQVIAADWKRIGSLAH